MKRFVLFIASLLLINSLLPAIQDQSVQAQESNVTLPTISASPQTESPVTPSLVHPLVTTPSLTPTTTISWTLVADTPYKGEVNKGYIAYCPRLTESPKQRVVIVLGSLGSVGPFDEDFCDINTTNDDSARWLGFDMYFINWEPDKRFDYVQRNAFIVTKLIQDIQQTTGLGPEADFVVKGPSLGGLIGRYALAYLEANNQPHHADLFFTHDSPLEGVYYPIGVQYMVNYFAEQWQSEQARRDRDRLINSPLGRQALIYHYETAAGSGPTYTDDYEQLFMTELQGQLGDYPHADGLRKVFVADGRGDGRPDTPRPGWTIMHWRSNKENIDFEGEPLTIIRGPVRVEAKPVSGGLQLKVIVKIKLPLVGEVEVFNRTYTFPTRVAVDVVARALPNTGTGTVFQAHPLFEFDGQPLDLLTENTISNYIKSRIRKDLPAIAKKAWDDNADKALGPIAKWIVGLTRDYLNNNPQYKFQEVQLNADHSYDGGPGGRDDTRIKNVEDAVNLADRGAFQGEIQYEFTFIPLHSALALDSPPPGVPIDPISVEVGIGGPPQGPFDEIHYPCKEQEEEEEENYPCENFLHLKGPLAGEVFIAELNRLVAAGAPPTDTTIYLPLVMK